MEEAKDSGAQDQDQEREMINKEVVPILVVRGDALVPNLVRAAATMAMVVDNRNLVAIKGIVVAITLTGKGEKNPVGAMDQVESKEGTGQEEKTLVGATDQVETKGVKGVKVVITGHGEKQCPWN